MSPTNFPDVPSSQRLREAVQQQVAALEALQHDTRERDRIILEIQRERERFPNRFQISGFGGDPSTVVLFVAGEILVDKGESAAVNNLRTRGFKSKAVDSRLGIERLVDGPKDAEELLRLVKQLHDQKVSASLNYVVATAAVGKGAGTPEPIDGPGPFGSYPIPVGSGGFPVGVIDTGKTSQTRSDGWLAGVTIPPNEVDLLDTLPPDNFLDRAAGHGTHTSGIVEQVAPGVTIRVYQALDTDGNASDADVADKMLQAVDDGCKILNLSCGTTVASGPPPMAMVNALSLIPNDVLIVAAAGNDGNEEKVYPAAFAEQSARVVSVAGLTTGMQPAGWSSRGSWVRASTIAEGVRSTFPKGKESSLVDHTPDNFGDNAWAAWTGTSFAAPQITGKIARICQQNPGTTPMQAWQQLSQNINPDPKYGVMIEVLPAVP